MEGMDAYAILLDRGVMGAGIVILAGAVAFLWMENARIQKEWRADLKAFTERVLGAADLLKQVMEVEVTRSRPRGDQTRR